MSRAEHGRRTACRRSREHGFTLLEVVVAIAILAISLGVLLEAQITSLHSASRVRNLTFGALLARSKMIDIEQKLFDDGFSSGDFEDKGDFEEEGHAEIKWKYKVSEVEISLDNLEHLGGDDKDDGNSPMQGMLGSMGAPMEGFAQELGRSVRVANLTVTWPDGKFTESMSVRALMARDDFGLGPAVPADAANPAAVVAPGGFNFNPGGR